MSSFRHLCVALILLFFSYGINNVLGLNFIKHFSKIRGESSSDGFLGIFLKSQRHLDSVLQSVFLVLRPGILPGFLPRDWCHLSILLCRMGNWHHSLHHSCIQGITKLCQQFLLNISEFFLYHLQVQTTLCLSLLLLQTAANWLCPFCFWTVTLPLHTAIWAMLEIIIISNLIFFIKALLVGISRWQSEDFHKASL